MHRHHFALFTVLGILGVFHPGAKAETSGSPQDLLTDKTRADWEFISATPTALDAVCVPGTDGEFAIVGKSVGYLATKVPHENYQLHFEWRWPANAGKTSNGGVLLHINSGPPAFRRNSNSIVPEI